MNEKERSVGQRLGNLALVVGLVGFVVVVGQVAWMSAQTARHVPHPPRTGGDQSPADIGATDYEDVMFRAEDGITLEGWYIPSRNGAAIILAHGYAGSRHQMLSRAQVLVEEGYGVLLFDFRGHGQSGGDLVTIGDHEQRDLRAAIDFVESQPDVESERIGGLGFSMGGATVIQVAATDKRLRAIIAEAAFPALKDALNHQARLLGPVTQIPARWAIRQEGVDISAVRPVDDICDISPRPVLLIYGSEDPVVPPGSAARMAEAACPPAELWIIEGAGHGGYADTSPGHYQARLREFFNTALNR